MRTVDRYDGSASISSPNSKTLCRSTRPTVDEVASRIESERKILGINFRYRITCFHLKVLRLWNASEDIPDAVVKTGMDRKELKRHILRFRRLGMNVKQMKHDF